MQWIRYLLTEQGILHNWHNLSLFETVSQIRDTTAVIVRNNGGVHTGVNYTVRRWFDAFVSLGIIKKLSGQGQRRGISGNIFSLRRNSYRGGSS